MTQLWAQYGLFLAKALTTVCAILVLTGGIAAILRKGKTSDKGKLEIKKLNSKYQETTVSLQEEILPKTEYKKLIKARKKQTKASTGSSRKRVFVIRFQGDIKASAVHSLREEVTALLGVATPTDEIVVCVESGGGLVSAYGLAASQLQRFKKRNIPLTVIIDKIAASGGYLMACVADQILAAPFAIIGSIGVVAQVPNFYRLLKKKDIDFELLTAGQYKRTLTMFGENTPEGRQKFQQEIEEIHALFKNFIMQFRPNLDIQKVATGEHWLATQALDLKLIDNLDTSDDYLLAASQQADVYQITYKTKKALSEKLSSFMGRIQADWYGKL